MGSSAPYVAATAYVIADRSGDALRWLERAVQTGRRNSRCARVDPLLAPALRESGIARVIDGVEVMVADMRRGVTRSAPN